MNRVNQTKQDYSSAQAKHSSNYPEPQIHTKHRPVYPEVAAEQRAQADCSCKLKKN